MSPGKGSLLQAWPALLLILFCLAPAAAAQTSPSIVLDQVLTGALQGPGVILGDRLFFSADNRRVYSLGLGGLRSWELERRTSLPLQGIFPGIVAVELSNGSAQFFEAAGPLSRVLSPEEYRKNLALRDAQIWPVWYPRRSQLEPASYLLLNAKEEVLLKMELYHAQLLQAEYHEYGIQFSYRVETGSASAPARRALLYSSSDPGFFGQEGQSRSLEGLAEAWLELAGPALAGRRISIFPLPDDGSRLLGLAWNRAAGSQVAIMLDAGGKEVMFLGPEGRETAPRYRLPEKKASFDLVQFHPDGFLVLSNSVWELVIVELPFAAERTGSSFFLTRETQSLFLRSNVLSAFLEEELQLGSRIPAVLEQILNSPARKTASRTNALFRILYAPILRGIRIDPDLRLAALDYLLEQGAGVLEIDLILGMLEYEYDLQLGLEVLGRTAGQYWPLLASRAHAIADFLMSHTRGMGGENLGILLDLYADLQPLLTDRLLDLIFPASWWEILSLDLLPAGFAQGLERGGVPEMPARTAKSW